MKNRSRFGNEQYANEIDGYLELGMEEEALSVVRVTLEKHEISKEEFKTCVFALLQSAQPELWKHGVEGAFGRLRKPLNDEVRSAMLNYYFSVREAAKATEFFPRQRMKFFDAWTMMQVCLELGRLKEAKKIARFCSEILAVAEDDFAKASMCDALAAYYFRIGDWKSALKFWQQAPAEPAFQRQRLCGIVRVHLMQALEAARAGLASVEASRQTPDLSAEIQLPGNNAAMMSDTQRELESLQRGIVLLLPEVDGAVTASHTLS